MAGERVRETAALLKQAARKATTEIDRVVSEVLVAEFKDGAVERRAALVEEIRRLARLVSEHIATLTEAHREVDLRLQALRRLDAPDTPSSIQAEA